MARKKKLFFSSKISYFYVFENLKLIFMLLGVHRHFGRRWWMLHQLMAVVSSLVSHLEGCGGWMHHNCGWWWWVELLKWTKIHEPIWPITWLGRVELNFFLKFFISLKIGPYLFLKKKISVVTTSVMVFCF